jgi:polyhydroxyalkanoate synthesis regulator phasin
MTKENQSQKTDSRFFMVNRIQQETRNLKKKIAKMKKKYAGDTLAAFRQLVKAVKTDSSEALDDLMIFGRKSLTHNALVVSMENKIDKGIDAVTNIINLPRKSDIEKLAHTMETLRGRVDKMNAKHAG